MLNLELKELSVMGADLAALGFTALELAAALNPGGAGLTDENEIPAVAKTAVTIAGTSGALTSTGSPAATVRMPKPSRHCSEAWLPR
jgi:hypothetical protein